MKTTISKLSELTGFDRRTIQKRLKSMTPDDQGNVGHFFDSEAALKLIYNWQANGEALDPAQERALLDRERRKAQELANQTRRRELISIESVFKVLDAAAITCREQLMGIPGRYSSIFAAQTDARQIEITLDNEIRRALESVADTKASEVFK